MFGMKVNSKAGKLHKFRDYIALSFDYTFGGSRLLSSVGLGAKGGK
jgi:hypothetical protein